MRLFTSVLFIPFFCFWGSVMAQGSLQFNQVINLTPGNGYTVPAGKVFKINSITSQASVITTPLQAQTGCIQTTCTCTYQSQTYLVIGNLNYTGQPANLSVQGNCSSAAPTHSGNVTMPSLSLPIWLKTGAQVSVQNNITGILVTGIEFNIIP
jgi:hypothetical protein